MKFNSKAGNELRTWILFFVGIALVIIFALKEAPLNPWWTLVIGAFTCTAVVVSAVQTAIGGMTDVTKKVIEKAKDDAQTPSERNVSRANSDAMGVIIFTPILSIYSCYSSTV